MQTIVCFWTAYRIHHGTAATVHRLNHRENRRHGSRILDNESTATNSRRTAYRIQRERATTPRPESSGEPTTATPPRFPAGRPTESTTAPPQPFTALTHEKTAKNSIQNGSPKTPFRERVLATLFDGGAWWRGHTSRPNYTQTKKIITR